MPWCSEMVFLGILNIYMVFSVGIEGTLGNWLYARGWQRVIRLFSSHLGQHGALGIFHPEPDISCHLSSFKQEHVLYCAHALCFLGTLCGLLAVHQHPKAASRSADSDGAGEEGPILDSWVLWTLTVSFGIGIAPSFPNVIGLANRLYPGSFSGVTQSFSEYQPTLGMVRCPGSPDFSLG